MRRSGQTTRLIDKAIQELFTKGKLYLVKKSALNRSNSIVPNTNSLFVDPDHKMSNQAQQEFIYRTLKRLEIEHCKSHKINTMSKDYIYISSNE